jgi:hypothetical protein
MASTILLPNLPPTGWSFFLLVSDEIAGERGQQIRVKQLGPDLWTARYEANQLQIGQARQIKAIVAGILMQRTTFYAWDPAGQYPARDKFCDKIIAPANIKINSLNADWQRMSLKGLPASYVLTRGDYLAFNYGTARALHQIWSPTTITANSSGITAEFWVTPRIRPGASIDAVVTLEKPAAEMMIVPGSLVASEGPRFA